MQLLSQQERALADLITNATVTDHSITHHYVKEMAQGIRESWKTIELQYLCLLKKN